MKTQIEFHPLSSVYEKDVNKRLAQLQPPRYQIVDIKAVPAGGDYTARCNIVIIYNEYEVNNDK